MINLDLVTELASVITENKIKQNDNEEHRLGNGGEVTIYPTTEDEIINVLKYANEHKKKVTVVGNGTKRGFGGEKKSADLLLSLENYKGIIEHTVGDMTLTVKSGTVFSELQSHLKKHQQKISLDPSWPENATIGGVIAANDSSAKRLGYGSARDLVIGLKMIYPDGSVIRSGGKVVKNVAGYDMNKLFIGSMGTLGVISEITMKLRPLPKEETLVLLNSQNGDLEEIRSFAIELLDTKLEPTSLELLTPLLAEKLTKQSLYTLAISFEDVESSIEYQEESIKTLKPGNLNMTILKNKQLDDFWEEFYKVSPNGNVPQMGQETEASIKIAVKNLNVIDVLKQSHLLIDSENLIVEAHGGLGHGICHVHLKGANEDIVTAINHLRQVAEELGGHAVVKHLPFLLRQEVNVWGEKPSYYFLLEGIKNKIDPNKTLNDSRFVGGI